MNCEYTRMNIVELDVKYHVNQASYESPHDKTNKMTCAPSEDSDQPGHLSESSLCA